METILFHLNQIGDFCFSLPVAAAVKERWLDARICSVVRPGLVSLAERALPIDSVEVRPRSVWGYRRLLGRLRARAADMAVVLPTSPMPCLMSRLCGARRVIGFDNDWARRFVGERVAFEPPPSLANNLRLAQYLCPDTRRTDYLDMLAPTDADRVAISSLLSAHGISDAQEIVVLAPFASARRRWKCWPMEYFAQAAVLLHEQAGLLPVVLGSADEAEAAGQLLGNISVPAVSLVGQTDVGLVLALLRQASVFIGIDTGLTHLSAALRCPTLAIFGPTDPRLTGPMGKHTKVIYHDLACSPCHNMAERCANRQCLLGISPQEAVTQAVALL